MTGMNFTVGGGGPYKGHMEPAKINGENNMRFPLSRDIVRTSWNGRNANIVATHKNASTPFRCVNNLADPVNRLNPAVQGIPVPNCNPKYVADSSDYTAFLKQRLVSKRYNRR